MHQHLLRRSLRTQLPPTVLEGPHQFLLLRVHGDHRLSQGELQLHRPVQVLKLGVAVRVFRPRQGLAIGLQAIAHVVEQFGDHAMADLVPLALQCRRQLTHALAGPAQRGLGIPTAGRLHQPVQVLAQARVMLDGALPAASRMADAALRGPYGRAGPTPVCRGESSREKLRWPLQPLPGHHARPPTPQRQAPAAAPARPQRGQSLGNELESLLQLSPIKYS